MELLSFGLVENGMDASIQKLINSITMDGNGWVRYEGINTT